MCDKRFVTTHKLKAHEDEHKNENKGKFIGVFLSNDSKLFNFTRKDKKIRPRKGSFGDSGGSVADSS